ncbi:hypothetical protein [Actinoplanes sp. CA-252034]|uniref:hypothetical protein n=1 Tax=Actinoplanes sp. CA-252034 TaxID=3239906 RepID=UPI003D995B42
MDRSGQRRNLPADCRGGHPRRSGRCLPPFGAPPTPGYAGGYPAGGYTAPPQRRFSSRAKVIAVALGVALVGGICLVPTLFRGSSADTTKNAAGNLTTTTTTTTTPATEATTTAAAPPLDPAAFQSSLDAADKQLAGALGKLRQATTPKAVSGAADEFAQAVQAQTSALSGLTAPPAVSAAHNELVSALSALEDELTSVSSSADSRSVCTGGSASAALSRADAAGDLRSAISALAAADPAAKYRFGSFVPAVTKDQNRRKANGTYLSRVTGGSGQLKIDNGNNVDTVIKLVKSGSKKPAVSVYIRGNKKVTTGRIKDGTYQVFMSSGTDWDGKRFTRDCQFSKFDSSLKFTTTSRQYTIWELSLKVRLGGNASSSEVDPDTFPS